MQEITLQLTESQYKSLTYIAVSPEEWITNAAKVRAEQSEKEIVSIYVDRALEEGVSIPSSKEAIVLDAFARGWVQELSTVQEERPLEGQGSN